MLTSSEAASAHAACLLGIVTHAANNHVKITLREDGSTAECRVRDSSDKPKRARSAPLPQPKVDARSASASSELRAPVAAWRPARPQTVARLQRIADNREALARRVEELGSSLTARASQVSGKERLELPAQRIRAKDSS